MSETSGAKKFGLAGIGAAVVAAIAILLNQGTDDDKRVVPKNVPSTTSHDVSGLPTNPGSTETATSSVPETEERNDDQILSPVQVRPAPEPVREGDVRNPVTGRRRIVDPVVRCDAPSMTRLVEWQKDPGYKNLKCRDVWEWLHASSNQDSAAWMCLHEKDSPLVDELYSVKTVDNYECVNGECWMTGETGRKKIVSLRICDKRYEAVYGKEFCVSEPPDVKTVWMPCWATENGWLDYSYVEAETSKTNGGTE